MKIRILFTVILTITCLAMVAFAQQEARLLRFPAIHGSWIVFTYAGDLYIVSATGGVARKLTNDIGFEIISITPHDAEIIQRIVDKYGARENTFSI
jgi:tricorn protease-like protein